MMMMMKAMADEAEEGDWGRSSDAHYTHGHRRPDNGCAAELALSRSLGHSFGTALLFSRVESGQAGVRIGLDQRRRHRRHTAHNKKINKGTT